jgi:hypothetical protein
MNQFRREMRAYHPKKKNIHIQQLTDNKIYRQQRYSVSWLSIAVLQTLEICKENIRVSSSNGSNRTARASVDKNKHVGLKKSFSIFHRPPNNVGIEINLKCEE